LVAIGFSGTARRAGIVVAAALTFSGRTLAGPPFVTDDPEPVDEQHWEINTAITRTATEDERSGSLPVIDANYGAAPDLQLHIQPQLAYSRTSKGSQFGVGDTEIGAKYRFVEEDKDGWRPMVAVYPLIELPTGDRKRGLGDGAAVAFLPIWIEKNLDQWTVYGGGGYRINPAIGGRNAWFVGGVALYQVTDRLQLGGEAFLQTAEDVDGKSSPGFNLGGSYGMTEDLHLLFSAGQGLANQAATNRFSAYLGIQVTD
jgi:hypothetical protein